MPIDMELEAYLRPPDSPMNPYPAKVITLVAGAKTVVRQVDRDAVLQLLPAIKPTLKIPRDYYDVVGTRLYAELLAWYCYRYWDEFFLIGQIDGQLVGIVNSRMYSPKLGITREHLVMVAIKNHDHGLLNPFAHIRMRITPQDVAELHDAFTILGIAESEHAGFFDKSEHPVGATGVAQAVELTRQLRGEIGKRQVKNAEIGFSLNIGGFGNNVVVSALRREA